MHAHWQCNAPSPKTTNDARKIRARLLQKFEDAEKSTTPVRRTTLLTFIVVVGGPTGARWEEQSRNSPGTRFGTIAGSLARVLLVEGRPRLLTAFPQGSVRLYGRDTA